MFALRHSDVLHAHNASKPQKALSLAGSRRKRFDSMKKSLPEWLMAELSNLKNA